MYGFYEFFKIYKDSNHRNHENMKAWAVSQGFRKYDSEITNNVLKYIKYKKTEWDKINHIRYKIIDDKYRESDI